MLNRKLNDYMKKTDLSPLNLDSNVPLYKQLVDQIRRLIKMKAFKYEEPLLKEMDIANYLGISRSVVRQAVLQLVNEGVLYRVSGKGTFVAKPSFEYDLLGFYNFKEEVEKQGFEFTIRLESFVKFEIDLFNASMFRVNEDDNLIEIYRTLLVDNYPVILERTLIAESIVPNLTEEDVRNTAFLEVFDKHGVNLRKAKKYIEPQLADSYTAEKLDINSGMPVLEIDRYTYGPTNNLIVRSEWKIRGDRCRHFINLDTYNI